MATEDTYGGGGEDNVRGRREDYVGEVTAAKRFISGIDELAEAPGFVRGGEVKNKY